MAEAAVAKQNTVPAAAKGGGVSSLSWSHTVNAGSSLLLVVGVAVDSATGSVPTGVTYNGVAMTKISDVAGSRYDTASAWRLVNPSTGSNTVQVTFAGNESFSADSISFEGVDQATPTANINNSVDVFGTSTSTDITTTSGDYAFSLLSLNIDHTLTVTAGTEEWQADNYGGGSSQTGGGASRAATTNTTTIAWSWTGGETFSTINFAIQQVANPIEEEGFRWRDDDGNETAATWLAAQDTDINRAAGLNTRLRVLLNSSADPASTQYQLEYKLSSSSTYRKVEVPSGSVAFGTAGAAASGSTALSVAYPANIAAGDLLVLAVANKYPNNSPTTPNGWTLPSNCQGSGGQGASGNDAGSMYSTVYVKEADGTESGNLSVTVTGANSSMGAMLRYTKGTGKDWSYACTNGSDNSGNANTWSITGAADPGITAGDIVVVASAVNTDSATFSAEALTATGTTWGAENERIDSSTTTGQDCALFVSDHVVATGTATAAPVYAATASAFGANRPAGAASILRIRQVNQPITMSASANIAASGENTTAQLAAPAGKATSDFVTGRMQDDENPADAVDITSNDYTELEWSIIANTTASNGQTYNFRVTAAGVSLDTYSVSPDLTIGSGAKNSSMFLTFD